MLKIKFKSINLTTHGVDGAVGDQLKFKFVNPYWLEAKKQINMSVSD